MAKFLQLLLVLSLYYATDAISLVSSRSASTETSVGRMPEKIRQLATSLLGLKGAERLSANATSFKAELQGRSYTFWANSKDQLAKDMLMEFGGSTCGKSCKSYKYQSLAKQKGGIAVDIGANVGDTSILALAFNPNIQVMSFEASPETYVFLKWNLLQNNIPEITEDDIVSKTGKPGVLAFHAAINADGKPVELKYAPENSYHAQINLLKVGWGGEVDRVGPKSKYKNFHWLNVTVPGFSLLDWFSKHDVPKPVWFKMDCEGCEYETLPAFHSTGLLKHADVVGEAHPRLVKDRDCKFGSSLTKCQVAERVAKQSIIETVKVMCRKFDFNGCRKVLSCGLYSCEDKKGQLLIANYTS